ncbi:MAG TPA: discoidin domain-containing protein [Oscillatoriaceae cyanobacterium]
MRILPCSPLALSICLVSCGTPPQASPPAATGRYQIQAVSPLAIAGVTVDSTAPGSNANALVDGNLASAWTNGGYRSTTAWASLTLGAATALTSIAIKTGTSPAGTGYDVQVSNDGHSWTTALANQTNKTWNLETKALPAGTSGKYVRVSWHNAASNPQPHFAIYELQAFGAAGGPPPSTMPTSTPTPVGTKTPSPVPRGVTPGVAQAAAAYAAHASFLGSGLRGPNGLACDGADNLYEADWNGNTVTKVAPNGASTHYAGGFKGPAGLAFDKAGDLLVAQYNGNTLEKVPPGGGSHSTFFTGGLNRPVWPAVNSHGTVYLADYSNNRILQITPDGHASTFKSIGSVNAIAIDNQDNLWICTWSGTVAKITPSGAMTTVASGLWTACAIAWCPSYLAVGLYGGQNSHNAQVLLVDFSGHRYTVATGLDRTSSVIFDSHRALYAANVGDSALRKYALQ